MGARTRGVKAPRSYDTTRRRAQADRRRTVVLDAAQARFVRNGYAATTVESIAEASGVSAATIYKTYGGKGGLVGLLCQRALAGTGVVHAETRSNALRSSPDGRAVIEGWGELVAEVSPRISPLLLLLRVAADTDDVARNLYEEFDQARLTRMAEGAEHLAAAGHLRSGVSVREARDVLWFCSSPEVYDSLVNRRRWDISAYSRFIATTMAAALL
ncbi:MAG: helix-turn-helix domain-containing protein [Acidimicrobiales bacterium]